MSSALKKTFAFLASYGLACVLFLLLLLLTYLGTLYQTGHGLYQAQEKYFASFFLVHDAFGVVPIPLPGGYLVSAILFLNLLCGAIIQAHKGWNRIGIFIAHLGICVLLIGSFISFEFALGGHMTLYEGESADSFVSYSDWEMAVSAADGTTEYVIPESGFARARGGGSVDLGFGSEPLVLTVRGYAENAVPQPASGDGAGIVDGFRLMEQPLDAEEGRNLPGAYVTTVDPATGAPREGIVWGGTRSPLVLEAGGRKWAIALQKREWQLPFTIKLENFTRELHPGTQMPSEFKSEVTKIEGGVAQKTVIAMNEPLRHAKYTFYQTSWGPPDAPPGTPLYSVFSVTRNPVEQFPLYACVIITIGLTLHFLQRLLRYLRREAKLARAVASAAMLIFALLAAAPAAMAAEGPGMWQKETLDLLSTLPEEKRQVLQMVHEQGMDLTEVAEAMGVPVGTVKSRLHYTFRWLGRQWLDMHGQ